MKSLYEAFLESFIACDKEACVKFAMDKLQDGSLQILSLYEDILKPALNNQTCHHQDKKLCIWKEHVRSAIVRTIIECAYPFVMAEKARINPGTRGHAAVVCPDGEYHELGARMAADYLTLVGFETLFIGGSTPKDEFIEVIAATGPDVIAISVTNYYNLVSAKKTIQTIRAKCTNYPVRIVVGGNAFQNHPHTAEEIGADRLVQSFSDIQKLAEEGKGL